MGLCGKRVRESWQIGRRNPIIAINGEDAIIG